MINQLMDKVFQLFQEQEVITKHKDITKTNTHNQILTDKMKIDFMIKAITIIIN